MSEVNSKKYYWLKLKDDFFNSREIKKLRKIAGGDTYTIIYLKMQLLSIKKEGLIVYEGTEQNIAEQIALELDEEEDNVKMTLAFLQANKLVEQIHQDEYLLTKVPETIGSETGAAERMRRMRERKSNIVTPQLPEVTKSYTEIEKREEIRDKSKDTPVELKFNEATIEYQLADMLYKNILINDDRFKKPNMEAWATNIDRLIRLDKRTVEEIKLVINYVTTDSFEMMNVLSTSKLRSRFPQLYLKAKQGGKNGTDRRNAKQFEEEDDIAARAGVKSF